MWNPYARPEAVIRSLKCSGGEATITLRPWGASERLAYEDASSVRGLAKDSDGERTVKMGTLTTAAITLTLVEASGFPPVTLADGDGKSVEEAFDPRREDHLRALDFVTFDEIRKHALDVQPLPTANDKGEDDEAPEGEDVDAGEDPSQEP